MALATGRLVAGAPPVAEELAALAGQQTLAVEAALRQAEGLVLLS